MLNQDFTSRELSFWQLAGETNIEIPIIQRDYAQGRNSVRKIRNNFLDALLQATANQNRLELDFVYGSVDKGSLQPLDGQQRLTTLFLLHWYIACKEGQFPQYQNRFNHFTYETRASSRSFCAQLALNGLNFEQLLAADEEKNNRVSKTICDASWFFRAWRRDPSIKAMLQMLDAIDEKFKNAPPIWDRLTAENRITFHYIELKHFGLSDDLYIKMNARGKPLTAFENFKAKLEQHILLKDWEITTDQHKFADQTDSVWTDLFWGHRDAEHKIDGAFLKYLAGTIVTIYAQNLLIEEDHARFETTLAEMQKKTVNKITNEAVKREMIEKRIERLFNKPDELDPKDLLEQADLDYLKRTLNCYANKTAGYDHANAYEVNLWDYCTESTLFKEMIKAEGLTTYKQRVLFYAQTAYLITGKFEKENFDDWMRVIRNIVQHATIDSASAFIGAIGLIKELSRGASDIYAFLAVIKISSGFASTQVSEEQFKSRIIQHDRQHRALIHAVEDTNFCKGRISFALFCIDYQDDPDSFQASRLAEIKLVIEEHLAGADISNDFRRALFTIGDNAFYNYWGTTSWSTDTTKRCMIENLGQLKGYGYQSPLRDYLKPLVNQLITKNLLQIIDAFTATENLPNWKLRLIKEPKLIDKYGKSRYFGITADQKACYLFIDKKRPGSRDECHKVI